MAALIVAFQVMAPIFILMSVGFGARKFGILNELYVKPQFRSQGIGEKLMSYANQVKEIKGWSRLEVSTPEESKWKRTLNFYLKEGFIQTGVKMKK